MHSELGGRAAHRLRAFGRETLLHVGRGQRLQELGIEPVDDRGRRLRGGEPAPLDP